MKAHGPFLLEVGGEKELLVLSPAPSFISLIIRGLIEKAGTLG